MLVDTSVLIWYALEPQRLSQRARQALREGNHHYSYASLWELAIKSSLGKIDLKANGTKATAGQFVKAVAAGLRLTPLLLEFDDLAYVEALARHHQDPFDRLLVTQAGRRNLAILSPDRAFDQYDVQRVW